MDIEVERDDLRQTRIVSGAPVPDEPVAGTALLRIETFALTANNVTYGTVGDLVGYWSFYPARDEGWGRIPVWGHAAVISSATDGVRPGDRFFGFWPMSTDVVVRPVGVGANGFTDGADRRRDLPAIYNRYQRATQSGAADADAEARTSLLQPLFATSFLIDAWLADEHVFDAQSVVLSSASSKTALGLAHLLKSNGRAEVVGLTSPVNADFVSATGAYDRVVPYGELSSGLGDGRAVFVDFTGDRTLVAAVHDRYGDRLQRSVAVGFTRGTATRPAGGGEPPERGPDRELAGPAPEFFFAPDHIERRVSEWGAATLADRIDAAREGFDAGPGRSMSIEERVGSAAIVNTWQEAVDGRLDPRLGIICAW